MTEYFFVAPADVLMPRGNKGFGGTGQHGEAVPMPWPSVFAGALRSAILARHPEALTDFVGGGRPAGAVGDALGTSSEPGQFRLSWCSLATASDTATATSMTPLPADLIAYSSSTLAADTHSMLLAALEPLAPPPGLSTGSPLPLIPTLRSAHPGKAQAGRLLDGDALAAHLAGRLPAQSRTRDEMVRAEMRLGIALDPVRRSAAEGHLYTTEALRFAVKDQPFGFDGKFSPSDAGYLVGIDGADGLLGEAGLLRLGGDGRPAAYRRVDFRPPPPAVSAIAAAQRFRLMLTTPAVFEAGWMPPHVKVTGDDHVLDVPALEGGSLFRARLACAALGRHEIVSGWNMATQRPKPAQRAVPTGSVYWFDRFEGDAERLAAWVAGGLWGDNPDTARRAEGFNRALLGQWA